MHCNDISGYLDITLDGDHPIEGVTLQIRLQSQVVGGGDDIIRKKDPI